MPRPRPCYLPYSFSMDVENNSESPLQDEDELLSLTEARIILSILLPVRVQQEQVPLGGR